MRGSTARGLLPAVLAVGFVCVVAIAATGSTVRGTGRVRAPSSSLLDTGLSLGLLAVVAGGVLVVYGLAQRRAIAREVASGRYPRTSIVGWILVVLAFTGLVYLRRSHLGLQHANDGTDLLSGARRPPSGVPPSATDATSYEPHFSWLPVAVALALIAIATAAYAIAVHRRRRGPVERQSLAEDVAAVLDQALGDLHAESDPRRAVIAAYVRLEHVLAAHGLPRRRSDTEEEYLARMLEELELPARPAERLTALFERARFSTHAMDAGMKEEAIGSLEQVRDELRAQREPPPTLAAEVPA